MQYSIVYSSRTGNTRRLAQSLLEVLPAEGCLYQGPVGEQALARRADLYRLLDG